jgi:hypothetical protein
MKFLLKALGISSKMRTELKRMIEMKRHCMYPMQVN